MSKANQLIGFMQGRLSELVEGNIQAFPWAHWENEFPAAVEIDLHLMEWTLDQERLYENPIMTSVGQKKIRLLCQQYNFSIPSLTGDCFMQAPFWKTSGKIKTDLQSDFLSIVSACATVGVRMLVIPLVDNGRLENTIQENALVDFLLEHQKFLIDHRLQVVFESDFTPVEMVRFIGRLPAAQFGINYDIGNSAALGFSPEEEFSAYGERVVNVHIKDRKLGGTTVPLKTGSADFDTIFAALAKQNYKGNFILQTARADYGNHSEVLNTYRKMTQNWIKQHGLTA